MVLYGALGEKVRMPPAGESAAVTAVLWKMGL